MRPQLSILKAASLALLLASTPAFSQAPANDNFASGQVLAGFGTVSGTNVLATFEAGEPVSHIQSATAARTVWYNYTPAATGLTYVSIVGQGGTTALAMNVCVYTGNALNGAPR